jgi:hypothetical protein
MLKTKIIQLAHIIAKAKFPFFPLNPICMNGAESRIIEFITPKKTPYNAKLSNISE